MQFFTALVTGLPVSLVLDENEPISW